MVVPALDIAGVDGSGGKTIAHRIGHRPAPAAVVRLCQIVPPADTGSAACRTGKPVVPDHRRPYDQFLCMLPGPVQKNHFVVFRQILDGFSSTPKPLEPPGFGMVFSAVVVAYGDLEELMEVENIQEVLYLYNANTFFSDTSLELALTPQQGA